MEELLFTADEVKKAVRVASREAYAKGRADQRTEFDALLARIHRLKELNGTGEVFAKAWREDGQPSPPEAVGGGVVTPERRRGLPDPKYGYVGVRLADDVAGTIRSMASEVRDEDLAEDGREGDPHVTVRYGFHTTDPEEVKRVVSGFGQIVMKFGGVTVFPGAESGKDYDVLKVDVLSPDLHRLHERLGILEHTDTHAEYKPHATIAYVKAGLGRGYADRISHPRTWGTTTSSVVFSDAARNEAEISLTGPDDADPHLAVAEAMLAHAEEAMAAGEDHLPGIERLRALLDDPAELERVLGGVRKGFDGDKHPRDDHGRFVSKDAIADAKGDPKKEAELRKRVTDPEQRKKLDAALSGETDLGRTKRGQARHEAGQRRQTRDEAKQKTQKIIAHLNRVGDLKAKLTADHLYELADHLGSEHVTIEDVRALRAALPGTGRMTWGGRRKDEMVASLRDHARGRGFESRVKELGLDADEMRGAAGLPTAAPGPPPREPQAKPRAKTPAKRKKVAGDSVLSVVRQFGGLDPNSLAFRGHYSGVSNAVEDGIPLGVFRKGGRGLDQLAQELVAVNLISVPEGRDGGEYLLELLRKRAHSHAADLSQKYEEALHEHARLQQEYADHADQAGVQEALRLGEAAGHVEGAEAARGGYGEGVDDGDGEAEGGEVDTSFDFGANVGEEPAASPPPSPRP